MAPGAAVGTIVGYAFGGWRSAIIAAFCFGFMLFALQILCMFELGTIVPPQLVNDVDVSGQEPDPLPDDILGLRK